MCFVYVRIVRGVVLLLSFVLSLHFVFVFLLKNFIVFTHIYVHIFTMNVPKICWKHCALFKLNKYSHEHFVFIKTSIFSKNYFVTGWSDLMIKPTIFFNQSHFFSDAYYCDCSLTKYSLANLSARLQEVKIEGFKCQTPHSFVCIWYRFLTLCNNFI